MKQTEDFKIISNENKELVEEQIKALMKEGWELNKTDFIYDNDKNKIIFTAALVKYKDFGNELLLD